MVLESNLVDTRGLLALGGQASFQTLEHIVRYPALSS